jgi:hypothetical protein
LPVIVNNNIQDNAKYSIYVQTNNVIGNTEQDINATYNWWGTTNTSLIDQSIHDNKDNFNLGAVSYIPFLTEPNPAAPATTTIPSTPTSSPNFSPTTEPTTLTVSCKSSTSYSNFKVEISGRLTADGTGLSDKAVLFSYSANGGNSWNDLTLVNTEGGGEFLAVWMPAVTGNYLIKAVWAGDSTYSQASTVVNLAVLPFEGQDVFSVTSNSTVSELFFNSASRELRFSVSGPSGTSGYVIAYISKSLISDVSGLKVYIDGSLSLHSVESQEDAWIVSFNYNHSDHEVTITLGAASASLIEQYGEWVIYGAIVAAVVVAAIILVARKN